METNILRDSEDCSLLVNQQLLAGTRQLAGSRQKLRDTDLEGYAQIFRNSIPEKRQRLPLTNAARHKISCNCLVLATYWRCE